MRIVNLDQQTAEQAFALEAAAHFATHPKHTSYSNAEPDLGPGSLLALRWGLHERAVLVLRIGDEAPVIYADLVPPADPAPSFRVHCEPMHVPFDEPILVPVKAQVCQIERMQSGGPYPRSCPTCGLAGNCVKGLARG